MSTLRPRPPGIGQLTPRRRQVLELIARGRTNWQIAEELGISLEGAKWHVREIMGELGVETREEAADYWRHERGLPTRLRRAFAGLVPAAAALRVGAAVGAIAVLGLGALLVVLALQDGDEAPAVPATPTEEPGAISTPGPSATPVVPETELRLGQPGAVPEGVVVYFWGGDVPHEGWPQDLRRAYRLASGELVIESVTDELTQRGSIYGLVVEPESGLVAAAICTEGYCGGYAEAEPGSKNTLFISEDGGVSWREGGPLPLESSLRGFLDSGLLVSTRISTAEPWQLRYWIFPDGSDLAPPVGAQYPSILPGRELLWATADGTLLRIDGSVAWAEPEGFDAGFNRAYRYPQFVLSHEYRGEDVMRQFVIEVAPAGNRIAVQWTDEFSFGVVDRLSTDLFVGNGFFPGPPISIGRAILLRLSTGEVQRLDELATHGGDAYAVGAAALGAFARVTDAGTCLNLREEPSLSAAITTCAFDGTLLRLTGDSRSAEGIEWRQVLFRGDVTAWASAEFLE